MARFDEKPAVLWQPNGLHHSETFGVSPGWWYTYPSEKYEFVSWDYEIPNIWKVIKLMFQSPPTSYFSAMAHRYHRCHRYFVDLAFNKMVNLSL